MKHGTTIIRWFMVAVVMALSLLGLRAQPFVHPGIDQTAADLHYLKSRVAKGAPPYREAFLRLKAAADSGFTPKPFTHVLRGPYGKPNIGGGELFNSAQMAYNYALVWYITQDKSYARKAMDILDAWSSTLWDFDYNDAKLLAAWTGHVLCNAAEILRYTPSGWQPQEINAFTHLMRTVYYPLMRPYYPQANGNWDGAIIHSLMAIAVFTDDRKLFNNAVDHFLHAPVNGSLFKYIYPSGQCQESTRDQGHVQLGLGEFAGAAQVAYTQGVDLFTPGGNRLALGYEYTAGFLLGQKPQGYGVLSERAKELRDDYESVYRHYTALGIDLPYTKKAADFIRPKASRSVLTAVRAPKGNSVARKGVPQKSSTAHIAGAGAPDKALPPADAIRVAPGESIQRALNTAAGTGRWVVVQAGLHTLPAPLKMISGVTLCGEGIGSVLFLDPTTGERETIVNADTNLHDVTIRDLVIEVALKPNPPSDPNSARSYRGGYNRAGILFRAQDRGGVKNISLINLTVQNSTYSGVVISGAENVNITRCDFSENGASVAPGPRLLHNLSLTHCTGITIRDCRLATSPFGSGIALDHCSSALVSGNEVARNGHYGIWVAESKDVTIKENLIEANDRSGVLVEYLHQGSEQVAVTNNRIQYNNGFGVETYGVKRGRVENNAYAANGQHKEQQKISPEPSALLD